MNIRVNGQKKEFNRETIAVAELLALEQVQDLDTVGVQINGGFLKREQYDTTLLNNGDEVEFLYFMGGGQGSEA